MFSFATQPPPLCQASPQRRSYKMLLQAGPEVFGLQLSQIPSVTGHLIAETPSESTEVFVMILKCHPQGRRSRFPHVLLIALFLDLCFDRATVIAGVSGYLKHGLSLFKPPEPISPLFRLD